MSLDIKMEHKITITDVDNLKYPILVTCTCHWQACCRTDAEADYHKRHHEHSSLMLEATKGYQIGHV